jgi:hypothetical protein
VTDPRPGSPADSAGSYGADSRDAAFRGAGSRDAVEEPTPDQLYDRIDVSGLIPDNLADLAAQESRAGEARSLADQAGPGVGAAGDPAGAHDPDHRADAAQPDTASPARSTPTIWEQMGGPMGMVDSGLPVVVFIVANAIGGLGWGIGAALAAAVVIAIMRIVRKRPVTQAIAGLFGVGIAAYIAYRTDSAKGYFLLGIWSYLLYGGALLVSMLVRWPAIGVIWEGINGRGTAWRKDKKLVRRYDYATLVWVLVFASRYLVQNYLYDTDQVGWLAAVRLLMGYPVFLIAIAVSVWIVAGGSAVRLPESWTRRRSGAS